MRKIQHPRKKLSKNKLQRRKYLPPPLAALVDAFARHGTPLDHELVKRVAARYESERVKYGI
jgi:hypothetical protein